MILLNQSINKINVYLLFFYYLFELFIILKRMTLNGILY